MLRCRVSGRRQGRPSLPDGSARGQPSLRGSPCQTRAACAQGTLPADDEHGVPAVFVAAEARSWAHGPKGPVSGAVLSHLPVIRNHLTSSFSRASVAFLSLASSAGVGLILAAAVRVVTISVSWWTLTACCLIVGCMLFMATMW